MWCSWVWGPGECIGCDKYISRHVKNWKQRPCELVRKCCIPGGNASGGFEPRRVIYIPWSAFTYNCQFESPWNIQKSLCWLGFLLLLMYMAALSWWGCVRHWLTLPQTPTLTVLSVLHPAHLHPSCCPRPGRAVVRSPLLFWAGYCRKGQRPHPCYFKRGRS